MRVTSSHPVVVPVEVGICAWQIGSCYAMLYASMGELFHEKTGDEEFGKEWRHWNYCSNCKCKVYFNDTLRLPPDIARKLTSP